MNRLSGLDGTSISNKESTNENKPIVRELYFELAGILGGADNASRFLDENRIVLGNRYGPPPLKAFIIGRM